MKVYITTYALTQGILEKEVEIFNETGVRTANERWQQYFHKPYWHEDKAEAINHAEKLRAKKIASLKKQLKKLEGLSF